MQRWDLTAVTDRDRAGPRVLFSTPEARGVLVDLAEREEMGDHQVRERAVVQVVHGSVACTTGTVTAACEAGSLIVFEPSEPHSLRALQPTRLLLILAPWPAPGHYDPTEDEDPHEIPVNATERPAGTAS